MNAILNADTKLKEAVIKQILDDFEVLATHPSQYGETEVLEMKIDLVPGAILYKSIEPRSEREFTRSNR